MKRMEGRAVVVPVKEKTGKDKKRLVTTGYVAHRGVIEARAETEAQALALLEDRLDHAVRGTYEPQLIVAGRLAVIVYRRPDGWFYRVPFDLPEWGEAGPPPHCTQGPFDTYEECDRQARFHLAQNALDIDDPARALSLVTHEKDRENLAHWVGIQRAYRAAVEQGQTGSEAHTWAIWHAREFVPQEEEKS